MKKIWNILFLCITIYVIVKTFIDGESTHMVMNYEMNIWAYRAIWLVIGAVAFHRVFISKPTQE